MVLSKWIEPKRCYELITGIIGIYICYLSLGILQESILKEKYVNDNTKKQEQFLWPSGTLIFPHALTWLLASIINHFTIPANQRTDIPNQKSAICGLTVTISTLTYTYAIYYTNFPVVMMFKSCNLISVLLVGVLCSQVRDKKLKLGTKKLVVGVVITIGIILFKVFDPQAAKKQEKKTQILGIVLLIVSLLADGFLPDFQAQIKAILNPKPMQMLVQINKWIFFISFLYSCCLLEIDDMCLFMWNHKLFSFHLLLYSLCAFTGQMFVYRMIKQFKQHFVPFVITTRKIFTVGLSIIWYHHATNFWQLLGLALVFVLVTYEFVSELVQQKKLQNQQVKQQEDKPQKQLDGQIREQPSVEDVVKSDEDLNEDKQEQV